MLKRRAAKNRSPVIGCALTLDELRRHGENGVGALIAVYNGVERTYRIYEVVHIDDRSFSIIVPGSDLVPDRRQLTDYGLIPYASGHYNTHNCVVRAKHARRLAHVSPVAPDEGSNYVTNSGFELSGGRLPNPYDLRGWNSTIAEEETPLKPVGPLGNRSPISPLALTLRELMHEFTGDSLIVLFDQEGACNGLWYIKGLIGGVISLGHPNKWDIDWTYETAGLVPNRHGMWSFRHCMFRPRHFALVPSSTGPAMMNDSPNWFGSYRGGYFLVDDVSINCS
jgi:hypothetical protein